MAARQTGRKQAVDRLKRSLILDAARKIFEAEGLEGASLRAIAAEAGYTPTALYFHFESKEAIYGEVLRQSLGRLQSAVTQEVGRARQPQDQFFRAAMGFFRYYDDNPRDLDLGFYLFRGGMKPHGLGRERDRALNAALDSALQPLADAARKLGASAPQAKQAVVDVFAHATGLLVLAHTGRMRLFDLSATALMMQFVRKTAAALGRPPALARRRPLHTKGRGLSIR